MNDFFKARDVLKVGDKDYVIYRLDALEKAGLTNLKSLPFSIRIVLEAALRQCNDLEIKQSDVKNIAAWTPNGVRPGIPFLPARVIMQDFTGVPAVVDLAAMRAAVARLGGDPRKINPLVPVDLVIDHSIQVDFFATADALTRNTEMEFHRNRELNEFIYNTFCAQHLSDCEHQVCSSDPVAEFAKQFETDDIWQQHIHRLAKHHRLSLDATHSPANHPQTVNHGRV